MMRLGSALMLGAGLAAMSAAAQTQARMNADAAAAFTRADRAMAREWRATYDQMLARDASDRSRGGGFGYGPATLASQRAWLAFRDRQCVIEGGRYAGGSMQPLATAQCRTRLTEERSAQLRKLRWSR